MHQQPTIMEDSHLSTGMYCAVPRTTGTVIAVHTQRFLYNNTRTGYKYSCSFNLSLFTARWSVSESSSSHLLPCCLGSTFWSQWGADDHHKQIIPHSLTDLFTIKLIAGPHAAGWRHQFVSLEVVDIVASRVWSQWCSVCAVFS